LDNPEQLDGARVRNRYEEFLGTIEVWQAALPTLSPAAAHFLKVTTSYQPGLFWCYDVPDLPRTNNDLEQYFGTARYQERRATGRKQAMPGLVIRGEVRVVASVATRTRPLTADELRPTDWTKWRQLRAGLEDRHETRREQLRFRREPHTYLARLEAQLLQPSLPP
jgi:hypothetical protein